MDFESYFKVQSLVSVHPKNNNNHTCTLSNNQSLFPAALNYTRLRTNSKYNR